MPKPRKRGRPRKEETLGEDWQSTSSVCTAIPCSRWHLVTLREQGILKSNIHYLNISPYAARPTYRYHLPRVREAISNLQNLSVTE